MHSFFRYPVQDYEPVRYVVNPVRCIQAFLCLGCFALAIYLVVDVSFIHVAFKVVLAVTAAAFATITIVDIISTSHYNPIFWNNWILFTLAGALFFFLCVGLLFATGTGLVTILIIAEILNLVTGIMFLLDAIYLINTMKKRQSGVRPLQEDFAPITLAATPSKVSEGKARKPVLEPEPEELEEEEIVPEEKKAPITEKTSKTTSSIQEKPSKRSTTSYGGTFPVAKDETPLPSPEPLLKEECRVCRKKSSSSSSQLDSSSQIIETPKGRLYRGDDGRMYLWDGTPLIPVQNERGEVYYQSADGVIYTQDGIPIVPAAIVCGPPPRKPPRREGVHGAPPKKEMKVSKSVDRSSLSLEDDQQPRGICLGEDGKLHLSDGTIVKPIKNKRGEDLYLSSDGVLYNEDGIPLASSPERVAQMQDDNLTKQTTVRIKSARDCCVLLPEDQRSQTCEESCPRIVKRGPSRSPGTQGSQKTESYTYESEKHRSQRMEEDKRAPSKERSQRRDVCAPTYPGQQRVEGTVPCPAMEPTETQQTAETIIIPCPATDPFHRLAVQHRSTKSRGKPQSPREITSDKGAVPRSTGHADQGRSVYPPGPGQKEEIQSVASRSTAASVAMREDTLSASQRSTAGSSRIQPREEAPSEPPRSATGSRTVAISTRMVPKGTAGRSRSAPGTQEMVPKEPYRRCSKSAEEPPPTAPAVAYQYQQQQPSSIYHQYVQKQCYCGKTHYQTATTVHGNVVASSCPFYPSQAVPPKQRPPVPQPLKACTPTSPCGNPKCNCCTREKTATYQPQPSPKKDSCVCSDLQQESDRLDEACAPQAALQTISECECETDPSSTWEQENLHLQDTTSDVSSIQQTSSDNVQETCGRCHTCGDERCSVHAKPPVPTDTGEVQTSETRMIRARDLQKLNQNLPGTADSFDR